MTLKYVKGQRNIEYYQNAWVVFEHHRNFSGVVSFLFKVALSRQVLLKVLDHPFHIKGHLVSEDYDPELDHLHKACYQTCTKKIQFQ